MVPLFYLYLEPLASTIFKQQQAQPDTMSSTRMTLNYTKAFDTNDTVRYGIYPSLMACADNRSHC